MNEPLTNIEGLPLPRLQLRWEKDGDSWLKRTCFYELVLPLRATDIRSEDESGKTGARTVMRVLIGTTTATGGKENGPVEANGDVMPPFRDFSHAKWDSDLLRLPAYVTAGAHSSNIKDL